MKTQFTALACLFLVLFATCKKDDTEEETEVTLAPNVTIIDSILGKQLLMVDSIRVVFDAAAKNDLVKINVGDIIASGPQPNAPYGFLRKVKQVFPDLPGQIIYATEDATLAETVENGSVTGHVDFSPADIIEMDTTGADFIIEKTDGLVFNVSGKKKLANIMDVAFDAKLELGLDYNVDVKRHSIKEFKLALINTDQGTYSASGEKEVSVTQQFAVATFHLKPLWLEIGPLPVMIGNVITIYLKGSAEAAGSFEFKTSVQETTTYGVHYINEGWNLINTQTKTPVKDDFDAEATLSASVSLNPVYEARFYGLKSNKAFVSVEGSIDGSATKNLVNGDLECGLSYTLKGEAGITASVLGIVSYNYTPVSVSETESIYSGVCLSCGGLALVFSSNQNVVTVTATGGKPPYSYVWNSGHSQTTSGSSQQTFTTLPATFSVTVTDENDCTVTNDTTLECDLEVQTFVNGDDANAIATGGTQPYQFSWSNGSTSNTITNVPPDTYIVVVTDELGCTASATAVVGSGCGSDTSMTVGGNVYPVVQIGGQCWMKENLRNGASFPTGLVDSIWNTTTGGAYAYPANSASNNNPYGKLYNGYAALSGGLCPAGWHIPSKAEWQTLINFLGGDGVAGEALKSSTLWDGTNSSGFSALPAGYRDNHGNYAGFGTSTGYWSSTQSTTYNYWAWSIDLENGSGQVYVDEGTKAGGRSCRCVKD